MSTTAIILITLIAYKAVLLGIGFWASRRVNSESDFFLGGQGLGAWTAGLSYSASTSSAWVLLGFTGIVFTKGVVGLWLVPGIFMGYIMTWSVMGRRLNAETSKHGHITAIDFLKHDLDGNWSRIVGIICALMILFCFVFYISSQFQAAGNALTEVFDMNSAKAIILGAAIIITYCLLGGFWAASITDALQALVMMMACILVPIAAVSAVGGIGPIMEALHANEPKSFFALTGESAGLVGAGLAMGYFGTGLGALGQPQLLNRIMAVKSESERRKAAAITIGWGVVVFTGLVLLAFAGRAAQIQTGDEALFFAAAEQYLPAAIAGVVIAAVLSAVMSTVDSLLLAAASAISHDMGIEYSDPKKALFFGRVAMVVVAIFAVLLTLFAPASIFDRVLFSWVALGAAFGPTILMKCLGWKFKGWAVCAAVLAGFFTAVTFSQVDGSLADVIEKWGSWALGLFILLIGRQKN